MPWTITIPGRPMPAPRGRASSGPTQNGQRIYMPARYRNHKQQLANQIRQHYDQPKIEGPLHITINYHFAIQNPQLWGQWRPHPGDADNLAKTTLDAINQTGTIWNDDRQVVSLSVTKQYAQHDHTTITIWPLGH